MTLTFDDAETIRGVAAASSAVSYAIFGAEVGAGSSSAAGTWTDFTPALTQGSTAVTRTIVRARYARVGNLVVCEGQITATSAGTFGLPVYLTLPVAPSPGYSGHDMVLGTFLVKESGSPNTYYHAAAVLDDVDDADGVPAGVLTGRRDMCSTYLGQTLSGFASPLKVNDEVIWSITYEAAP